MDQRVRLEPTQSDAEAAAAGDAGRAHGPRAGAPESNDGGSLDLAPLVHRAAAGDEQAWSELLGLYGRRVYGLVRGRCRNPEVAREITQTVFAKVSIELQAGRYEEAGKFEPWLFRIAVNKARDELRRQKRRARLGLVGGDAADRVAGAGEPEEARPDEGELEVLRSAMNELTEADREILSLRHHGQMSFPQMADLLGQPVGTLLARHHRALKKLRTIMTRLAEGTA